MFNLDKYLADLILNCRLSFGKRLLYMGLQGNWLRGEAHEDSDIDVMVILDRFSVQDMDTYMLLMPINDFESIKATYMDVIEHTPEIERYARWVYGKHPTDEAIRSYIDNGEMVALMDGDQIAAIAAIVMHQGPDYEVIAWADSLASDEVATLHLLAVCPGYRGHEPGMVMLEQAMELAGQNGKKALHPLQSGKGC